MRFDDIVNGAVLVAVGVCFILLSLQFEPLRHIQYGPGFFPTLIGAGFVGCGVLLLVRRVVQGGRWRLSQFQDWVMSPKAVTGVLLVLLSVIGYIVISEPLGFVLTMFALLSAQLIWFSRNVLRSLLIAVVTTLCLQVFFQGLLGVPLPWGVLEPLSGALTWL